MRNERKAGAGLAAVSVSAPSWDDFCDRLLKEAPQLQPDLNDQQWSNLYGIYQMGYEACLEQMKSLLQEAQNDKVSDAPDSAAPNRKCC